MESNKITENNESTRSIVRVAGTAVAAGKTGTWREAVATFISSLDIKGSSRSLYARTLSLFFEWVESEERELDELTRIDVLEYKDFLIEQGLSNLTICSYLVVVRKFYAWAESMKLYPNIADGVSGPRRRKAFKKMHLTEEKCRELLDFYMERSLRDYAIVNLILRTGLRTIEVVRLDIKDITFKGNRRILKLFGKGWDVKDDFVVLTDKAYEPIKEYLRTRKSARPSEPLFICVSNKNQGGRLTTRSISRICKEGLVAIGLDGREFTAHSLRHTTAVEILKRGGGIADVQDVLRHASPATSQIYTESIKGELRLDKAPEFLLDDAF